MELRYILVGKIVFSYCGDSSWAQWEKAGFSLRLGRHLFAVHHVDYREKQCAWPRWLAVSMWIRRPA